MQRWEYRSVRLRPVASLFTNIGWRLIEIDEQKEEKTRTYTSVVNFCNELGEQGWELVSIQQAVPSRGDSILFFKRPRTYARS